MINIHDRINESTHTRNKGKGVTLWRANHWFIIKKYDGGVKYTSNSLPVYDGMVNPLCRALNASLVKRMFIGPPHEHR